MKFGEYLQAQLVQEWKSSYLDYDKLKKMIKQLEEFFLTNPQNTGEKGTASPSHSIWRLLLICCDLIRYLFKYPSSNERCGNANTENRFRHHYARTLLSVLGRGNQKD